MFIDLAIDCLDLCESLNGRKHVVIAMDVFTRFVIAKAIKNLRASCFVKFLRQTVGLFGVPRTIITDNAPFFCNEQTSMAAKRLKFEH